MIGGVLTGNVFPLAADEITVGRDPDNTIGIPDGAISRRHCAFRRDAAGWRVSDPRKLQRHLRQRCAGSESPAVRWRSRRGRRIGAALCARRSGAVSAVVLDEREQPGTTKCFVPDMAAYLPSRPPSPGERGRTESALRVLLAISTVVNSIRDEERLCRELLDLLFKAVPAEEGAILRPGSGDALEVEAVWPVARRGPFK